MSVYRILGGIYLSSIEPLNSGVNLKRDYGIHHILSVIPGPIPAAYTSEYHWKQIEITDEETTNLFPYLEPCYKFIDEALFSESTDPKKHSDNILIHCSQGVSRSVAIVMSYLMKKYKLNVQQSLHAVKRKCPDVGPNEGFVSQLKLYKDMGCVVDEDNDEYRQFLVDLNLKLDPSGQSLRELMSKRSESTAPQETEVVYELRCKRCRQVLANNTHIEQHEIPVAESRQSQFVKTAPNSRRVISIEEASDKCSHYFMKDPLKWMKEELDKSEIEGKFQCPKCTSKVGGYSWRGSRCSCGKWMIPAIHLQQAKTDCISKNLHAPIHQSNA
ncbi:nitrogen starvation-induced protein phosphatase [Spathaspora passalidarum NRRL Y-27907]|uniref:protein-tyrosine-phosphatase n=1 Tax=Spathaspora passalidarum (strain NRRL Y-27907 / 11-Y1) TaxID=619300 RepID=G3AI05_SPAPN|nr:nitrogen starvation-induced protein phosphatase [Spathaspora passalidarum NRRL Y-27907]EGW34320.1 nitrogen starvation-induced protein phosphatase [Spathaspora passalidarum NRRL Y-27907]